MNADVRGRGFSEYTRLDRALEMIFARVDEANSEKLPFNETAGRVLAEDVKSEAEVPPFDRAAMDGFAVRAADTFGADENNPRELRVIDSIEIGSAPEIEIGEGESAEIATGAPMPEGADATVRLEEARKEDSKLEVFAPVTPGENVSSRGEDVKAGQTVLKARRWLRPSDIGILASVGQLEVEVKRRPKVGIAITGSELREPGESLGPGEIVETNSHTLGPAVRNSGGAPTRLGIVPDQPERIREVFKRVSDFDLLILTGGSSVGEKDLVPVAMSELGQLVFHGVAMRPGGPSAFGMVEKTPVFSLAGFPAAALIAFEVLVRPALRAMQGLPGEEFRPKLRAQLDRKISSSLGRVDIVRVKLREEGGGYRAEQVRVRGSSILSTVSEADGMIMVPEESEGYPRGGEVEVHLLDL